MKEEFSNIRDYPIIGRWLVCHDKRLLLKRLLHEILLIPLKHLHLLWSEIWLHHECCLLLLLHECCLLLLQNLLLQDHILHRIELTTVQSIAVLYHHPLISLHFYLSTHIFNPPCCSSPSCSYTTDDDDDHNKHTEEHNRKDDCNDWKFWAWTWAWAWALTIEVDLAIPWYAAVIIITTWAVRTCLWAQDVGWSAVSLLS